MTESWRPSKQGGVHTKIEHSYKSAKTPSKDIEFVRQLAEQITQRNDDTISRIEKPFRRHDDAKTEQKGEREERGKSKGKISKKKLRLTAGLGRKIPLLPRPF